jgi:hypothetical protein
MTVAEMVTVLADHGFHLTGRASKVISDALRWEIARGRVVRLARGLYRYHRVPGTTARRIELFAHRCRLWLAALRHGRRPPPTPRDPRATPWSAATHDPSLPPWWRMGWLWTT